MEEAELRLVLSWLRKGWYRWEKVGTPSDPQTVDLADLPAWVTRSDDRFAVNTGHEEFPREERFLANVFRRHWAGDSKSDFVAMVRAFRAFKTKDWSLRDRRDLSSRQCQDRLRDWCFAVGLNMKRLDLAEDAMRQTVDEIRSSPLTWNGGVTQERVFDESALSKALASGLVDNLVRRGDPDWTGRVGIVRIGQESAFSGEATLALVAGVHQQPYTYRGKTYRRNWAGMAAPIEAAWLREVLPHLCESRRLGDHAYDPQRDDVRETSRLVFQGDLELSREPVPSSNEDASAVFAAWVAAQMLAAA